jgi:Fic family protein
MKPYEPERLPLNQVDWAAHVTLIGQANAALARYDGMLQSIVNPGVMLSPLTTQEAVLSSRIEGTQPNMEEVLEYEADPGELPESGRQFDIQEILNYRRAMATAVKRLKERPLCLNLIKELHAVLLDSARGRNRAPGEFRRIQNFIGPPGCTMETATFVPPSADRVGPGMDNLEKYLHAEEKDRLVQLAIAKAQFELIHPFLDGNGRIGRILIPVFLFEKDFLSSPMFYLSSYLEEHRDEYYERLRAISRHHDWNGWIRFFLTAVRDQAWINAEKTRNIIALYERMKDEVQKAIHSQYIIKAIDAIFDRPVFLSAHFIKRSRIPKDSAHRILNVLKKSGILCDRRKGRGRRATIMEFTELLKITEGKR